MKKLAIAITSLLLITGCSSTPTITNTKNIKEYILKDNVAYDSFSSYSDSDTIIRLPNGEYIHGTKEVNGKYYDSDQDSGAIQAKKAKYYALLAMDVNNYLTEEFEGFNDSDEVFYNKKNGGFTDASTVMDENGNEKDLANNPNYDSMTVKEAKEKFGRTVWGGFDNRPGSLIYTGTKEEIEAEVKRLVEASGKRGYIIGPDCSIHDELPEERIKWIVDAARKL